MLRVLTTPTTPVLCRQTQPSASVPVISWKTRRDANFYQFIPNLHQKQRKKSNKIKTQNRKKQKEYKTQQRQRRAYQSYMYNSFISKVKQLVIE